MRGAVALEEYVCGAPREDALGIHRHCRRTRGNPGDAGGVARDADVRVLSGGERQALAIGRAMYFGARLVILDEPTTALSLKEVKRVLEFIQALRDKGRSVLLVSHHVHQAYDVADRFLFMDKGRTVGEVRRGGTSPADLTERLLSLAEGRGA